MNRKSENNKFDIVLEAEAVLNAYNRREHVLADNTKRRATRKRSKTLMLLSGILIAGLLSYLFIRFNTVF